MIRSLKKNERKRYRENMEWIIVFNMLSTDVVIGKMIFECAHICTRTCHRHFKQACTSNSDMHTQRTQTYRHTYTSNRHTDIHTQRQTHLQIHTEKSHPYIYTDIPQAFTQQTTNPEHTHIYVHRPKKYTHTTDTQRDCRHKHTCTYRTHRPQTHKHNRHTHI